MVSVEYTWSSGELSVGVPSPSADMVGLEGGSSFHIEEVISVTSHIYPSINVLVGNYLAWLSPQHAPSYCYQQEEEVEKQEEQTSLAKRL